MARTGTGPLLGPDVGFVGCCLPRPCGIATFTYDLVEAFAALSPSNRSSFIVAMNDRPGGYAYPERVRFEIDARDPRDYALAAEFLNESCSVVCLQHEYGIFGLPWGEKVLHLVRRVRRPLVVTCHTVAIDPEPEKREVFREIVRRADKLVVMNRRAIDFMQAIYGARYDQIEYIRHGIHDMPFRDPPVRKERLGVSGPVLLSFGLLNRNKGLEYAIEAMAEIVRERPDTTYVIAGATHPRILEAEGESYRLSLQGRVRRLGLEKHVRFIDGFCDLTDLMAYLYETDVYVSPYVVVDQMTSGALSYAAGAGKAVVSTPYFHARELLADGRGRLVPMRSARALARHVLDVLADRTETKAMRRRLYRYTRPMVWRSVAQEYARLFAQVRERSVKTLPMRPALGRTVESPLKRPPAPVKKPRPAVSGGPAK